MPITPLRPIRIVQVLRDELPPALPFTFILPSELTPTKRLVLSPLSPRRIIRPLLPLAGREMVAVRSKSLPLSVNQKFPIAGSTDNDPSLTICVPNPSDATADAPIMPLNNFSGSVPSAL